jgi:hypothetical protein
LGFAWPLEVDNGASPSLAVFFTSVGASSIGSQGKKMVWKLKLCFISFSCLLVVFRLLLAGFQHL